MDGAEGNGGVGVSDDVSVGEEGDEKHRKVSGSVKPGPHAHPHTHRAGNMEGESESDDKDLEPKPKLTDMDTNTDATPPPPVPQSQSQLQTQTQTLRTLSIPMVSLRFWVCEVLVTKPFAGWWREGSGGGGGGVGVTPVKDLGHPRVQHAPAHSALSTVLLHDPPLKAHLQPWNHLCIRKYTAAQRQVDLRCAEREKMVRERERPKKRKRNKPKASKLLPKFSNPLALGLGRYDALLLVIIGVLEAGEWEGNVAGCVCVRVHVHGKGEGEGEGEGEGKEESDGVVNGAGTGGGISDEGDEKQRKVSWDGEAGNGQSHCK
ncbi:hypothetical protein H0H92_003790 [Tricholoma furcatifolium]|nr:hypothetical protein H0H92_003790 [Tricholoma furcatifolium]